MVVFFNCHLFYQYTECTGKTYPHIFDQNTFHCFVFFLFCLKKKKNQKQTSTSLTWPLSTKSSTFSVLFLVLPHVWLPFWWPQGSRAILSKQPQVHPGKATNCQNIHTYTPSLTNKLTDMASHKTGAHQRIVLVLVDCFKCLFCVILARRLFLVSAWEATRCSLWAKFIQQSCCLCQ